jgi:diguanylate cyclase (GGDEF)-like protein
MNANKRRSWISSPYMRKVLKVSFSNIAFYALAALTLFHSERHYEEQAILATQNLAYALETSVADVFGKIDLVLLGIQSEAQQQLAARGIDAATLHASMLQQRAQIREVETVGVADASGAILYGPQAPAGQPPLRLRDDILRAARDPQSQLIIAAPGISAVSGKRVVLMARRLNHSDGGFAGVVYAELPLDHLARLIAAFDVGRHGIISLRSADMALVARFPEQAWNERVIGSRTVSAATRANVAAAPAAGSYRTVVTLDGIARRMAYRKSPRQPFYIFVGLATQDYLQPWWQQLAVLSLLAAAFTASTIIQGRKAYRRRKAELAAMAELRGSREELQHSELKLRTLYNSISDAVWLVDAQGLLDCNRATLDVFGCDSKHAFLANSAGDLSPTQQPCGGGSVPLFSSQLAIALAQRVVRYDWVYRRLDTGRDFHAEVLLSAIELDGAPVVQAVVRDISERKQAEERIRHLAYYDALTDLPNRRMLMERLDQAVNPRSQHYGAMLVINLDSFKGLNDIEGRAAGDRLLCEVAQRLRDCATPVDTVARVGADEFIILLANLACNEADAAAQAAAVAQRIRGELCHPYQFCADAQLCHATAGIGITLYRGQRLSIDDILRQGEAALAHAKQGGRNGISFFTTAMLAALESRALLEAALGKALQRDEFQLYYQPQVDLAGRLVGAEALLRWLPPDRPSVSPAQFIPLAEESGLIVPLGLWVLHTACAQLQVWAGEPDNAQLTLSINVSARQFRRRDFVEQVRDALQQYQVQPALLKLELTESVLLDSVDDVIERMHDIRALGVKMSMDDFGTGFSSLSYLRRLPLDQLKIDQSFVRDVTANTNDAAIVHAIIVMSQSLGLHVIAEGVETAPQHRFLAEKGCHAFQGYLFGKPMPIAQWPAQQLIPDFN